MSQDQPQSTTILVVDDIADNRDILGRRLERRGFRVLLAEDGPRALAIAEAERLDLVLLDIMMPGMSGIEVLDRLRRKWPATVLPIIMVSGKDGSDSIVEALDYGANDYVIKPVDFPVLFARVQTQLQIRGAFLATPSGAPPNAGPIMVGPGSLLLGKYRLHDPLGTGGFGTVYRAQDVALERDVAVKVLSPMLAANAEARERFRREGLSACRLKHPNVVTILDFHADAAVAFLVMELLAGVSLFEEMCLYAPMTLERAAGILGPVLDALGMAHGLGIVHRDIKPSNIFLEHVGETETPKLLDFGIARVAMEIAAGSALTASGSVLGTPAYIAPERLRGQSYGGASDIYGIGVTLFQMLTDRMPFDTEGLEPLAAITKQLAEEPLLPRVFQPDLPMEAEHLILRALAKEPTERPSAMELGGALREIAAGSAGYMPVRGAERPTAAPEALRDPLTRRFL